MRRVDGAVFLAAVGAPLLAAALMGAALTSGGALIPGDATADIWGHSWGYWWVAEGLKSGVFPLHGAPVNHPDGQSWWVIDLPVAVLLSPVSLALDAGAAFVASHLLRIGLAAAGVAWWLRRHAVSGRIALFTALMATVGPYTRGVLHSGIPEALGVLAVPWFAGLLAQGLGAKDEAPRLDRLVYSGLVGALLVLDGAYAAIAAGVAGVVVLAAARPSVGRFLRGSAVAVTVGLVGLLQQRGLSSIGHRAISHTLEYSSFDPGWQVAALGGADLLNFVLPSWAQGEPPPLVHHRHVAYLGVPLLLAAAWAGWRHRVARILLLAGLLAAFVALGSHLRVAGHAVLTLPGSVLTGFGAANVYRVAGFASIALLAAVAVGLSGRARVLALGFVALDQTLAFPVVIPSTATPATEVDTWLAEGTGAVLDLPLDRDGRGFPGPFPQVTFFHQTRHGRPIASGFHRVKSEVWQLATVKAVQATVGSGWSTPVGRPAPSGPRKLTRRAWEADLDRMRSLGFTALSYDGSNVENTQQADVRAWLARGLGEPVVDDGVRAAWSLEAID